MLDLVVNSLRMRPDRIIMGEIRRKREAEVLFEAMHTGHSVYATLHANNAEETVVRLTNPPIDIPKKMLGAISLIVVQNRNRRTGLRRTFQIAEVTSEGDDEAFMQFDIAKDALLKVKEPKRLLETLNLYRGMTPVEIYADIREKEKILRWLVEQDINDVNQIGLIMSKYYSNKIKHRSQ